MTARWSYLTPSPEEASSSDEVQTGAARGRTIPDVAQLQSGKSGYRGVGVTLACETVHVGDPGEKQEWYGAIGKDKGDLAGTCTQGQGRAGECRRGFEQYRGRVVYS